MSIEEVVADRVAEVVREQLRFIVDEVRKAQETQAITADDAAKRMGVSKSTVVRMMRTGELPSITVGRYRRIRVSDLPSRR